MTTRIAVFAVAVSILTACTSARNLVSLDHPAPAHIENQRPLENIVVGSGRSEQPHSTVLVGAWVVMRQQPVLMFDLVIKNPSEAAITAPDLLYAEDTNGVRLPLLSPSTAVAILYGQTQAGAYTSSAAMMGAAGVYALANPSPSTTYSYGTASPNMFGGYNYSGQSYTSTQPNYAASAMAIGGLAMAAVANEMGDASMKLELLTLKPQPVSPGATIVGKVLFLDADLPVTLHVFAGGDHHLMPFDSVNVVKYGKKDPQRRAKEAMRKINGASSSLKIVDPYNGQWPPRAEKGPTP